MLWLASTVSLAVTVSALHGIGKGKAVKIPLSNKDHCATLKMLRTVFQMPAEAYEATAAFTFVLYDQKVRRDVNYARCLMGSAQTDVYHQARMPYMNTWELAGSYTQVVPAESARHTLSLGNLTETSMGLTWWHLLPPALVSILELVYSSCKATDLIFAFVWHRSDVFKAVWTQKSDLFKPDLSHSLCGPICICHAT